MGVHGNEAAGQIGSCLRFVSFLLLRWTLKPEPECHTAQGLWTDDLIRNDIRDRPLIVLSDTFLLQPAALTTSTSCISAQQRFRRRGYLSQFSPLWTSKTCHPRTTPPLSKRETNLKNGWKQRLRNAKENYMSQLEALLCSGNDTRY